KEDAFTFVSPLVAGKESKFVIPKPLESNEALTSLRVTDFKSYLACPYRYYLKRRLKLEGLDDSADELDPGGFGSLANDVLKEFASGAGVTATDAEQVLAHLNEALDKLVAKRYGNDRLAAISVQAEQIRARLGPFARWQAERTKEGWRIES